MAEKNSVPRWLSFAFLFFVLSIANLTVAQTWGNPVWSDEFNGSQNAAPDSAKWTFDVGNLGVNNEIEIYCSNPVGTSPAPCNCNHPERLSGWLRSPGD